MFIQITGYVVLDQIVVLAQSAETTPQGMSWTRLVQESHDIGVLNPDDGRDVAWLACQIVAERMVR